MITVELTDETVGIAPGPSSAMAADPATVVPDQVLLAEALDRLPGYLRQAVVIATTNSGHKPLSYRRLGELLGVSHKTAGARYEEGLRRLRLILATTHPEDHTHV